MSAIAALPAAVVIVVGTIVICVWMARVAAEAARLGNEFREWGQLRPALVRVQSEAEALRAHLEQLRTREG